MAQKARQTLNFSGAARETSHSVVCQNCGTENMILEYLCLKCGEMLPIETVDVDGWTWFRNSAIPAEDQEILEIGNTIADFDLEPPTREL